MVGLCRVDDTHSKTCLRQGRRKSDPVRPRRFHHDQDVACKMARGEEPELEGSKRLRCLLYGDSTGWLPCWKEPGDLRTDGGDINPNKKTIRRCIGGSYHSCFPFLSEEERYVGFVPTATSGLSS